jgi:hypothetical protein
VETQCVEAWISKVQTWNVIQYISNILAHNVIGLDAQQLATLG